MAPNPHERIPAARLRARGVGDLATVAGGELRHGARRAGRFAVALVPAVIGVGAVFGLALALVNIAPPRNPQLEELQRQQLRIEEMNRQWQMSQRALDSIDWVEWQRAIETLQAERVKELSAPAPNPPITR